MNARVVHPNDEVGIVELWLRGRPATTRRAYQADYRVLVEFTRKRLSEITTSDLYRFAAEVQGSPATRSRRIAGVRSLMGFACRVGFLAQDPSRSLRLPKNPKNLADRVLREDEVVDLINEARKGRDQVLLRTLYISGIRISEAVGLRWRDVGRRWLSVAGKGAKPRSVLVPEELIAELRGLRQMNEPDDGVVFRGRGCKPISAGHARRIVRTAAMEALGKPASPHFLRHSHACHAVEHGVPLHVLQASLGHSSLSTTSVYLHARPNQGSSQYLRLRS